MSTERIESLLAEIRRNSEHVAARNERLARTTVHSEIAGELGSVAVNGFGRLREIRLNERRCAGENEAALGKAVVAAVHAAERKAAALRAENRFQPIDVHQIMALAEDDDPATEGD